MRVLLLLAALAHASPAIDAEVAAAWDIARAEPTWRSPYAAERSALRRATVLLADSAETCPDWVVTQARDLLDAADLQLQDVATGDDRVLLIREGKEHRGAGLFAIRCGPAEPRVLQAPHAFYDVGSGDIVRSLFAESRARAAMWNTVHRYRALPEERPSDTVHPADVAHEPGSLFQAATVGLAVGDPTLKFIQIHGFGRGMGFDAVVSTGDADKAPLLLARKLEPLLGKVGAYGQDVQELGGTTNAQGRMLDAWDAPRFLHIELDREARDKLASDPEARKTLLGVLTETSW